MTLARKSPKVLLISSSPLAPIPRNVDTFKEIVHFNRGPKIALTSKAKNVLYVRQNPLVERAKTFEIYPTRNASKLVRVGWTQVLKEIDPHLPSLDLSSLTYEYPAGKSPSTGFAVLMDFLERGFVPYLSGFDLTLSLGGDETHDYEFETLTIRCLVRKRLVHRVIGRFEVLSTLTGLEPRWIYAR